MASGPVDQPYLHDLVVCLRAPTVALGGADGQVGGGVQGVLRHDRRVLSELTAAVDGRAPAPVGHTCPAPDRARFTAVVRHLGDPGADPTVRLERERWVTDTGVQERLELVNASSRPVRAAVRLRVTCDLAPVDAVKHGEPAPPVPPTITGPATAVWRRGPDEVTLTATGAPQLTATTTHRLSLVWRVRVAPRQRWSATVTVTDHGRVRPHTYAAATPPWRPPVVCGGPVDLRATLARGTADLAALMLADAAGEPFVAAGVPWYLTLFGRDALWSARFLLPLGTDLAAGTLRALAAHQGRRTDPETGEAPGRIPHEVRSLPQRAVGGHLVYYGSVDATCLWVCLLHDAWRWGMPDEQVATLLDPLEAAVGWIADQVAATGFLTYHDTGGRGLVHQGWKDSGDAIRRPDGSVAAPPIALCEAQGYAHEALVGAARLLEHFGRPGAERLRNEAAGLRDRFREAFWVTDHRGRFPAVAVDGSGTPVAVATSNPGHLLGTGLLDDVEAAEVAARLAAADLDSGYGLRTLSSEAVGFNPWGYHVGSVWPHDTAIAVRGLVRDGQPTVAARLAAGLLRATPHFGHRLPELYAGVAAPDWPPLPYPAACRPQGWSAASVVAVLAAALGLDADVPTGRVQVDPPAEFADWFPLSVSGLRVAGCPLTVTVSGPGQVRVETDAPVTVHDGRWLPRQRDAHPAPADRARSA